MTLKCTCKCFKKTVLGLFDILYVYINTTLEATVGKKRCPSFCVLYAWKEIFEDSKQGYVFLKNNAFFNQWSTWSMIYIMINKFRKETIKLHAFEF